MMIWGITIATVLLVALVASYLAAAVAAVILLLYLTNKWKWGLAIMALSFISEKALTLAVPMMPRTYDAALWRLDGSLGFDPSAYVMGFLQSSPVLYAVAWKVYEFFPLILIAGLIASKRTPLLFAKIVAGAIGGYFLYFFIPACGPLFFLNGTSNTAWRNAVPSLHFTGLLLVWQELREHSLAERVLADFALLFTAIATVGLGQHYVVDLVLAVPFWLLIEYFGRYNDKETAAPVV